MAQAFLDIGITPSVRAVQAAMGVDEFWRRRERAQDLDRLTADETDFIAGRDSFYLASVSETGWPYVQHRGGPPGFLQVLDDRTLACADVRGNRQYLSVGNVTGDDRTCLFLMDYARRARLKIYARAEIVALDADPALTDRVVLPAFRAKPERILKFHLHAFDWNCPQHITPRFTEAELAPALHALHTRLQDLEAENAQLRARLAWKEA